MSDTEKAVVEKGETTSAIDSSLSVPPVRPSNERQETGLLDNIPITPAGEHPPSRVQRNVHFEQEEEEEAPPRPARPTSPNTQNLATLIEAFPDVDTKIVKAVLTASSGQVEPAFNALLGMSDPNFEEEQEAPPPMPPRPTSAQRQLEADEAYARRLAQKYQNRDTRRYQSSQQQAQEQDKGGEFSFFDDFATNELPEIRKNLQEGFQQTQARVNGWITGLSKRINGGESDDIVSGQGSGGRQDFGPGQGDQLRGIRRQAELNRSRHSMDTERYDADAPALSENFGEMDIRGDDYPPRKPNRPLANPNLFKPTPNVPSGPIDEVDNALNDSFGPASATRTSSLGSHQYSTSPNNGGAGLGGRSKKWQPLTSLTPAPDAEADDDNDPFSLGDSDDEALTKTKSIDVNAQATERLKAAASKRVEEDDGDEGGAGSSSSASAGKVLQQKERSGNAATRDKVAEELLKG